MNRVFVSLFIAMYTLEISGHLQNKAFKKNHLNNPSSTPLLPFLLSTRLQGLELSDDVPRRGTFPHTRRRSRGATVPPHEFGGLGWFAA